MRLTLATEYGGPADDGSRRWGDLLVAGLRDLGHDAGVLELSGDARTAALRPRNWLRVRATEPELLLYVPGAGLTRNALFRLLSLGSLVPRATSVLVALFGPDELGPVPRPLRVALALCGSKRLAQAGRGAAGRSLVVPPAVDLDQFRPGDREPAAIREELGLDPGRPLLLHVGHLRAHRNLDSLAALSGNGDQQVVLVASPRFEPEPGVERLLAQAGVRVVREFVPRIERYYQAADAYVFPVVDRRGAIDVPLTVLEALACGVPVATTRFGALPEFLPPAEGLAYAEPDELGVAVHEALAAPRGAGRGLVEGLSPRRQAEAVVAACEEARAG